MSNVDSQSLKMLYHRVTDGKQYRLTRQRLIDLEEASANVHAAPWTLERLETFLAKHNSEVRTVFLDYDGPVKMIAWIGYTWDANWNQVIHRAAVRPGYRRQGVGRWLLESMVHSGPWTTRCEVPERDLASQLFLRACGFKCDEILYRFAEDGGDCYSFTRKGAQ